jgi:diacylglycerol kinase
MFRDSRHEHVTLVEDEPSVATSPSQAAMRAATLRSSFGYAFAGLKYLLLTQRNAQIHSVLGLVVIVLGLLLQIDRIEWIILIFTIALVLATEGMNTAVEAAVDLASPEIHPLAKTAKDVAAGVVLLTAIAALLIGIGIFLPRLLALVGLQL